MKYNSILLIDDNEVDLYVSRFFIEGAGLSDNIIEVNTGAGAIEYLNRLGSAQFPCLIFLDLNMPEMNGFEFLDAFDKIRQEKQQDCKIIILSSSDDPEDVERSRKYKYVVSFIQKPLDASKLASLPLHAGS